MHIDDIDNYHSNGFMPRDFQIPMPEFKPKLPTSIQNYRLVTGYDAVRVQAEVCHYLSEGWHLYGNLAVDSDVSRQVLYAQAMTREEVTEK